MIPKLTHEEFEKRVERIEALRDRAYKRWKAMCADDDCLLYETLEAGHRFDELKEIVRIFKRKPRRRKL